MPEAAPAPAPSVAADTAGRAPFFIVGADRSGTTLLRLYLNAHSRLAVPSESWFLIDLLAAFGPRALLRGADLDRAVSIVTQHQRFRDGWHVDGPALRALLAAAEPLTLAGFCDRLYRLETGSADDVAWGDKTPEYVEHLGDLGHCFPDGRFIHLIRDGRDVYLSLARRRWSDRGYTPHELGRYWSRCVRAAADARSRLEPGRFLQVRYEDLVLDTVPTLQRITAFLGVAFEPRMLRAHGDAERVITARESAARVHEKLFRAPRPDDVERWRRVRRDPYLRLGSGVMAKELRRAGYRDAPAALAATALRTAALSDHLWRRRLRPRLRRLARKVAPRAKPAS